MRKSKTSMTLSDKDLRKLVTGESVIFNNVELSITNINWSALIQAILEAARKDKNIFCITLSGQDLVVLGQGGIIDKYGTRVLLQ